MTEKDIEKGDVEKVTEASRGSSISVSADPSPEAYQDSASIDPATVKESTLADDSVEKPSAPSVNSTEQQVANPVPRGRRRGLLAWFALLPEVDEPKKYSRRRKWIITFIIAIASAAAPLGSGLLLRESQPCRSSVLETKN